MSLTVSYLNSATHRVKIGAAIFLFAAIVCTTVSAEAATAKKLYKHTATVGNNAVMVLNTYCSSVTVLTSKGRDVRIEAVLKVHGRNYKEAEDLLNRIVIATVSNDSTVSIKTTLPPELNTQNTLFIAGEQQETSVEIAFQIFVPEIIDLDIASSKGTIDISGVTGTIRARTTERPVNLENIRGTAAVYTKNADITVQFLEISGPYCELTTSDADITVSIPENARVTVQADTENGSVSCGVPIVLNGPDTGTRLFGWINGGGVESHLYTDNGRISIQKLR